MRTLIAFLLLAGPAAAHGPAAEAAAWTFDPWILAPLLALGLTPGRYDGAQEDVGATVFHRLTGEEPPLAGRVIP